MGHYACFARGARFYKAVTRDSSDPCPDAPHYNAKLISGVDAIVLIGACLFPRNDLITAAESAAKALASSGGVPQLSLEPIHSHHGEIDFLRAPGCQSVRLSSIWGNGCS
jgi:hypothetical protein